MLLAKAVAAGAAIFIVASSGHGSYAEGYAAAHRASKVREGLAAAVSVTEAIYDAGLQFSGRFYEKSTDMLGMTPTQFKTGGLTRKFALPSDQTSLGAILGRSSKRGSRQFCSE